LPSGDGFELASLGPDGVASGDDRVVVRHVTRVPAPRR
jgi:hypothetical protein